VHQLTGRPISALQTQWDHQRTAYDCTFIGLRREREDQSRRANRRVGRMIETGLVEEVRGLLAETPPIGRTARQALGYAEIIAHLEGEVSLEDAIENIKINTRAFLKAQRTWFKRFRTVRWIDLEKDSAVEQVASIIESMEDVPWSKRPR
jgi:tRNA dimethylallyltransferase